jgi:hypothetical protein
MKKFFARRIMKKNTDIVTTTKDTSEDAPENTPEDKTKKVSVNITLNLNIKESDAEKIISILDSYF